jgi:hypothetical protein
LGVACVGWRSIVGVTPGRGDLSLCAHLCAKWLYLTRGAIQNPTLAVVSRNRNGEGRKRMATTPHWRASAARQHDPLCYAARLPPPQIGYVNAIVESHEGMCLMRTRDPGRGLVEFWVMRKFDAEFERMIEGLRTEFPIEVSSQGSVREEPSGPAV